MGPTTWRQHILEGGTTKSWAEPLLEPYRFVLAFLGSILAVVLLRVALQGILGTKKV